MSTDVGFSALHGEPFAGAPRATSDALPHRRSLAPEIVADVTIFSDICLITASGTAVYEHVLATGPHSVALTANGDDILTVIAAAFGFVALFRRLGGYSAKRLLRLRWQLTWAVLSWLSVVAVMAGIIVLLSSLTSSAGLLRDGILLPAHGWIATTLILLLIQRYLTVSLFSAGVRRGVLVRNVVVVGTGSSAQDLIEKLKRTEDPSLVIRGVFSNQRSALTATVRGCPVLGTTDDLLPFARRVPVDEIIIALPLEATREINELIEKLSSLPADLCVSAEPIVNVPSVQGVNQPERIVLLPIVSRPLKSWGIVAKWVEDKFLAIFFLVITAPVMLLIALLIKLESAGPLLFVQERFGFNNNVIRVFKFRSMYVDRGDQSGRQRTVRNDPRVTRVGRILRTLSLDELPQLLNVLRGEMSLIGPRAHPVAMMAGTQLYPEAVKQYAHRHRMKPGITGWAQVNGNRGEVDTVEKAEARVSYDLAYIEQWSLWLDLKILAMTVKQLLSRQNAY